MIKNTSLGFNFYYKSVNDISGLDIATKFLALIERTCPNKIYERALEYCSGTASMGFNLLHHGKIKNLLMSDINGDLEKGLERTISNNHWQDCANFIKTENLSQIPKQKFDIVFANPPWRNIFVPGPIDPIDKLKQFDIGWALHRHMYNHLHEYVTTSSDIFIIEDSRYSSADTWKPMLGHFEILDVHEFAFMASRKDSSTTYIESPYVMRLAYNGS